MNCWQPLALWILHLQRLPTKILILLALAESGASIKKTANYEELSSVNETRQEKQLDGSTENQQDGEKSLPVMKHGDEPPVMLLAILNSALSDMIANKQAAILGTGKLGGRIGSLLVVFDAIPDETANKLTVTSG